MWLSVFLVGVVFFLVYRLLHYWIINPWRIHRDLWAQGIPGEYVPIFGDVLKIRRAILADDPMSYYIERTKKLGSYHHSSFGPIARLMISDSALIQGVLKSNARSYHKSSLMALIVGVLLGEDNLLMSEDAIHSQHRRLIAPAFQQQNVNSMISLMVEITSNLLDQWTSTIEKNQQPLLVDFQKEMARLTLDIVAGCVFGSGVMKNLHARETIHRGLTTTLEDIEERTFSLIGIIPLINQLPLASKRRIDKSKREVRIVIQSIIDERRQGLSKSACKGPDLLDLLLSAHGNEKASQFNDEELFEEALTFVMAGHETTSNLMTWTLFNLTNNADVCHRLENELDTILADQQEELDASSLSLLTYTESVLKESLRLHQPIPAVVRTAIEDNTLVASDGQRILVKKGTNVLVNFFGLHHSEANWKDPYRFDPTRFTTERQQDIHLPFSAGPRSCIGQSFAMLEAKVMLAMMIQRFSFELVPGQKHAPDIAITMRPKYGMWMKISPRRPPRLF